MMALAFDHLLELVGNQLGVFDRACPLCLSRVSNSGRPRRVIRIWREHEDFARYYCTRCGEKGWAKSDVMASSACPVRLAAFRRDAGEQRAGEQTESLRKAR